MKILSILIALLFSFNLYALDGLKVGDSIPKIFLSDLDGNKIDLKNVKKKTVLVFYRGSWCPYCVKQLISIQNEFIGKVPKDFQLLPISVDRPKVAKRMKAKNKFTFSIVSDPKAESLKAFKIVNKLDDKLVMKYKSTYQIDVEGDSGETHHMVAHPAVFILENGKISFADIHTDYKDRTKNSDILNALK